MRFGGSKKQHHGFERWVRTVQSGFVRSYALLLVTGFAALALYFLIQSS